METDCGAAGSIFLTGRTEESPANYSSEPSKQNPPLITLLGEKDGCAIPLMPWALGRTQATPTVNRSTGAELAGAATLLLGTLSLLLWIRTRDELRLEMVRPRLANTKSKRGFLPVSNV